MNRIKALDLPGSEKKNFEFCLLCSHVQIEVNKEMLHTKYQSLMPFIFREEEF